MTEIILKNTAETISRLRSQLGATQSAVAQAAGIDQSKLSRIEKGEIANPEEAKKVLKALGYLGSSDAESYLAFSHQDWQQIPTPSFWNPQREILVTAENTLLEISAFLEDEKRPWPLRRQIERHKSNLEKAASYLNKTDHNIAFIGDIGVGKSTAISFLFDLLNPAVSSRDVNDRPVLETGAGGTTICEVHIKSGPEFGLALNPAPERDVRALVADFASAKWAAAKPEEKKSGESASVSREIDRAIRNMSKLSRKKIIENGKTSYQDPVKDLALASSSEEDFLLQILERMQLPKRDRSELWYNSSTRKHPLEWVAETFKKVNNGRMDDCPLPSCINLLIPNFDGWAQDISLTVIDTKGVDDLAVREDLDSRLKDPRTASVFCSRFNDAPGTSAKALLHHMRETHSDNLDDGKVFILALPRTDEARAMKDDMGDQVETDEEGYGFKNMQLEAELTADEMENIPIEFLNVESDNPDAIRNRIVAQVVRMRKSMETRLLDICSAARDIIDNHEAEALNAAVEEVAKKLGNFIKGTPNLTTRGKLAYFDLIGAIKDIRHASTLWASTRRNGIYSGLNAPHMIGVGVAKDAKLRADLWCEKLDAFLASLEADDDLAIASKVISEIRTNATQSKGDFVDLARNIGVEVYGGALTKARVWHDCAEEWGQGKGFKNRVIDHIEKWGENQAKLQDSLDRTVDSYFDRTVIKPLQKLTAN